MATELIVRSAFGSYPAGYTIIDPSLIATILSGPNAANVYEINDVNSSVSTISAPVLSGLVAGDPMVVSGTFANGVPSGISYSLDGGSVMAAFATIGSSTYSFTITAPTSGSHSIIVLGNGANSATSTATYFATSGSGTGGTSGTVNNGTTGTLGYYAANGTALSPLSLGTNLSITGSTLNAAGGGGGGGSYTLPAATTSALGGIKSDGATVTIAGDGTLSVSSTTAGALTHRTLALTDLIVVYDSAGNDYYINPGDIATLFEKRQTVAYASTITVNWALGRVAEIAALTGNPAIANPTNPPNDGAVLTMRFVQDSTGSRVPTWGTQFKGQKTLSTAAGAVDEVVMRWRSGSSTYECSTRLNIGA